MFKKRKSLVIPRRFAYTKQKGRCYYCEQPMWSDDLSIFASMYNLSLRKAKIFQCTGEHLVAFKDGGSSTKNNIVAACWFCNQKRHRRKTNPTPEQYKQMIRNRLSHGRWHGFITFKRIQHLLTIFGTN